MTAAACALIVDDEDDISVLVSMILVSAGFRTVAVEDAVQALALAEEAGPPDVYVPDVRMPEMNGHDLCRRLKADTATSRPVLLVSAQSCAEDIAAAFAAGCDDFLPEPFTPSGLLERIEHLLQSATAA